MSVPKMFSFDIFVCALPVFLLARHTSAHSFLTYLPVQHQFLQRSCGTSDPSNQLRSTHKALEIEEPLDNDLWNATMVQERHARFLVSRDSHDSVYARQAASTLFTIDTYIHIVDNDTSASPSSRLYVTDLMIQDQFEYLQLQYASASIGYRLVNISRTLNNVWASNGDDQAMKSALRRGSYSALNIYYQADLRSGGAASVPDDYTLLGYCTLPAAGITRTTNPTSYILDGCNVLSGTLPGGVQRLYNHGGTTVHEVGHWNGLLHTFQDNTCSEYGFGDYVADTPQQAVATGK